MSHQPALAAISRMHMGVAFLAPEYSGFAHDMQELAKSPVIPEAAVVARRNDDLCSAYGFGPSIRDKPFAFHDGIAIIAVHGTLINRYSYGWSFVTGYNYIRAQMNAALDDDDVKLIVFDINSYGGEAAGCFELSEEIREARERKSLLAVVDSNCCSAAYAIASACSKVIVTPSGQAGSIGVIAMHVSYEKMLDTAGIEVTIISSFEHKGDANPYKKLPESVRADLAEQVEKRAMEFVSLVALNRNLEEDLVRATESRTFRADDALQRKLIDAVQTPSKAVATFFAELGGTDPCDDEDEQMSQTPAASNAAPAAGAAPATPAASTPAAPAASNAAPAPDAGVIAAAVADALTAERARVSGIMGCDDAKGRQTLAQTLVDQGMSVDNAKAILAAAPKGVEGDASGGDSKSPFTQAMEDGEHPNVGADGKPAGEGQELKGAAFADSVLTGMFGKAPTDKATAH